MAVVAKPQPDRIPDLLGYRSLIIEAHLEYGGNGWIGYDKRFCLNAAANSLTTWTQVDTTLWHLAFTGKAKTDRCKYCFSLTHPSDDCDWAPTTSMPIPQTPRDSAVAKKSVTYGMILQAHPRYLDANSNTFAFTVHTTHGYRTNFISGYTVHIAHQIAPSNADDTSMASVPAARLILLTHSYISSSLA